MKKWNLVFTLWLLLYGSAIAQNGTISGTVTDDDTKETLAGVSISVLGTSKGTLTDSHGRYEISLPFGSATIQVSFIGFKSMTQSITINSSEKQTIDFTLMSDITELEAITVVGSRNSERTVLETPVPVDIISIKDLATTVPQFDLNQMLTFLAPSFQSNRQTISDGTDHIDPASLRGLGPDQVLVLVNGKRRHNTALVNVNGTLGRGTVGTDLNTIPASAIERIEVLRDGAAAQYGSDAIAGVINIVLKKNTNQLTANYATGIHKEGDGQLQQFNANYGFQLGNKGHLNITTDYTFRGYTNRMKELEGTIYGNAYLNNATLNPEGATSDDELLQLRGLTRADFNTRIGNSQITNTAAMFNLGLPVAGGGEFYAFGGLNYRNGIATGFYRTPAQSSQVVYEVYPNGFLPEILSFINDKSLGMGIRGKVNEWNIDFSNVYGLNRFRFQVENSINASLGPASQTSFNSGGFSFSQNITSLGGTRNFPGVLQGLNVAMGTEFRVDNYQIVAGQEESYTDYDGPTAGKTGGAQAFPGFQKKNEVNRFRTNIAAYTDVEVDITDQWMIAAAGRFENYSDFGQTVNGKLATRFNINDSYAIRGAVSTGFRAPALHQLYFNTVSTLFVAGVPYEVGTFSNNSQAAKIMGIPQLKEETSLNLSAGFTARPVDGLSFSVDAYQIKVDNRIVLTGQFQGSATAPAGSQDREIYDLLASIGANRAQFFSNSINTTTKGIDVISTYGWELGSAGKLDLSIALNFNETSVDKINIASTLLSGKENVYFDREQRSMVETGNPKSKYNFTANYKIGKFSTMVRTVNFGSISFMSANENPQPNTFTGEDEVADQTFRSKWVTDVSFSYQIAKGLNLQVGSNNLFDVYPDRHTHSANYSFGRFPYSRRMTQFGFNGAFYFARLGVKI